MKTHLPKINLDQRKWHVIDADGAVLCRLAAQVANILRGKNKPVFTQISSKRLLTKAAPLLGFPPFVK